MKKISKNFLSMFISDAASRVIGFFATVYIARLLAVEGFGLISYGLAFLSYALLFANPGLTTIGAREVAKDPHNRRIINEILGLRIVLAIVVFLVLLLCIGIIPGQALTKRIILFYSLSIFPFAILLEFVFQGREEMEYIGISRLFQYGVYIIVLFILVRNSQHVLMVPISFLFGYCAAAVFLIVIFFHKYKSINITFSLGYWRNILAISIPVGLATIFGQIYLSLPPIILGIFHTKTDVGFFSASYKIIVMLLIIDRVFYYVFFPILTKQYIHAQERLKDIFSFVVKVLLTITIPLTVGGIILGEKIIHGIYGAEYAGAFTDFRILLGYFLIAPLTTIFGYGLVSINQEKRFFKVISIATVVNVVLIVIFGIYLKGPGAAAALLIGELVSVILMNRELQKFVKFGVLEHLLKPLLASIIMGISLAILYRMYPIILVIVGVVIYVLVLYVLKGFTKKELDDLKKTFIQQ
jgi:O-antigen/teichoic acid export membrane protein